MLTNAADALPTHRRGVAVVVAREGRLLVIRRSAEVRAPGAYCFPGGGIEPGESEEQAVAREMAEELGVSAVPVRRLWQSVTPWQVELAWWLAEVASNAMLTPNPAEVDAVYWLTMEELVNLPDLLASNREFLQALRLGVFTLEMEPQFEESTVSNLKSQI